MKQYGFFFLGAHTFIFLLIIHTVIPYEAAIYTIYQCDYSFHNVVCLHLKLNILGFHRWSLYWHASKQNM